MEARIISYSQTPENLVVGDNIQEIIAYCARVSNPDNQMSSETPFLPTYGGVPWKSLKVG